MPAQKLHLVGDYRMENGAKYEMVITVRNPSDGSLFDLTGYTCVAQIRSAPGAADVANFVTDIDLGASEITLSITPDVAYESGEYDVFLVPLEEADAIKILKGRVTIDPHVTEIP